MLNFPSPNDRSPNNPAILVMSNDVVKLYNKYTSEEKFRVNEDMKKWFYEKAVNEYKWDFAEFRGNQCLLITSFNISKEDSVMC